MFLESKDRSEFFFNDCLLTDFLTINFGHERCLPSHSFGPQVREYFVLHYILNGKGTFSLENNTYSLNKGDFFMISPNDSAAIYQADNQTPWEYVWFGFEGNLVDDVLHDLGYNAENRVGHLSNANDINRQINQLLTSSFFSESSSLTIQGRLIELISRFSLDGSNLSLNSNMKISERHVEQFVLYIRQNYWRADLTIEKIAADLSLNSSYLSRVIKKAFNQSTLSYLINYRLLKAKFLLENSDHTVSMISKAVGYQNPLSFSRAYKRVYGHSPRK